MNIDERLSKIKWREKFGFECYGVKIAIRIDDSNLRRKMEEVLPRISRICDYGEPKHIVSLVVNADEESNGLYYNDEIAMEFGRLKDSLWEYIGEKILLVLAMNSLPSKFYIHAGAVGWNDFGILLPGTSRAGKTTLTRDFIKAGADYFSDDCVILDDKGYLFPFPRPLAVRTESGDRHIREAEYYGAKTAADKMKLKLILFAQFEENCEWSPEPVTRGQGIMELMNNFYIKSSIGLTPGEIISSLNEISGRVEIYRGKRSDTQSVIEWVFEKFGSEFAI
jgi:serine kinase of HPr protein (carbohydrate metabolism regulator)